MFENNELIKCNEFTIEGLVDFLSNIKNMLVNMNIYLKVNEINTDMTDSLNLFLLKDKNTNEKIYDFINDDYETIGKNVEIIEEQIKLFNSNFINKGYHINILNVTYVKFYREIEFLKKLIIQINEYLNCNINLIYVYDFLISKIYDDPQNNNFIYILSRLVLESSSSQLKDLLNEQNNYNITSIKNIINVIFDGDISFKKLLKEIEDEKETYNKNFDIIDAEITNIVPIDELENSFLKEKKN